MGISTTDRGARTSKWFVLLPALVGFVLYLMTWNHGFVLDDNLVITQNSHVLEGFKGIGKLLSTNYAHGHQAFNDGLYRPLSLVTFAIEKSLFDLSPKVSHLVQSLLYGVALLLLALWLRQLFGHDSTWPFWIALVFAVHPIHTEVVANLKGRDELLAFLFFSGSAWQFTRWLDNKKQKYLYFAVLCLTLALFSKENAVAFIAVFPLLGWYRKSAPGKIGLGTAILAAPLLIFLLVRYLVLKQMGPVDSGVANLLQNSLMEIGGIPERIATAARIQGLYFQKLTFPFHLSHDYSFNAIPVVSLTNPLALLFTALIAGLFTLSIWGATMRKWWAFGILFYFITIAVAANLFVLIGAMAAERFLFTPSLGWSFAAVAVISGFHIRPTLQNIILSVVVALFVVLSATRIPDWKSNLTLFTTDVERVPESARAHYNAGSALIDEAKASPRNAVQLLQEARQHLEKAISIWPGYQDAYNNLGIAYMNARDFESAYKVYAQLIEKHPDYLKARYNMGVTSHNLQRYADAELHFERFISANPANANALFLLAESEGYQNKFDEAITHLKQLILLEPRADRGYLKLGMAYAITGNTSEAELYINKALQLNPGNAEAHFSLGLIFLNTGRQQEAFKKFRDALQKDPGHQRAAAMLKQFEA